jgi:hypothetical protein
MFVMVVYVTGQCPMSVGPSVVGLARLIPAGHTASDDGSTRSISGGQRQGRTRLELPW